jgi:aspartate ammonia-lyase
MSDQSGISTRIESDKMAQIEVPGDRYWGAQTQCARTRGVVEDILVGGAQYGTGKTLIDLAANSRVFNF